MSSQQEKIRRRIQALLAKTTENGATEHEAMAALDKAKELMLQHMISSEDLTEKQLKDKLVRVKVQIRQQNTIFDLPSLCMGIGQVFDVQYFYIGRQHNIVYLFGLEEDIELATYFLQFISKQMFMSLHAYKSTEQYKSLKNEYGIPSKRISIDFTKGFIDRMNQKLYAMYRERNNFKGEGLIIAKASMIRDEFVSKFNPKVVNKSAAKYRETYDAGIQSGNETELTQGLNNAVNVEEMLKIDTETLMLNQ